jgi:hypothetical protein
LTQFLVNTDGSTLQTSLIQSTEHLSIIRHEIALEDLDEFKGNDQADGYEGAIEYKVRSKSNSCNALAIWRIFADISLEIDAFQTFEVAEDSTTAVAEQLENQQANDKFVYCLLDLAYLSCRQTAVHHYPRI